jgi:hypothetical protein
MQPPFTKQHIIALRSLLDAALEDRCEQVVGLLIPNIEAVDINLSHRLDDLAQDVALGLGELQGQIELLEQHVSAIREQVNSLFR